MKSPSPPNSVISVNARSEQSGVNVEVIARKKLESILKMVGYFTVAL